MYSPTYSQNSRLRSDFPQHQLLAPIVLEIPGKIQLELLHDHLPQALQLLHEVVVARCAGITVANGEHVAFLQGHQDCPLRRNVQQFYDGLYKSVGQVVIVNHCNVATLMTLHNKRKHLPSAAITNFTWGSTWSTRSGNLSVIKSNSVTSTGCLVKCRFLSTFALIIRKISPLSMSGKKTKSD